MIDRKAFTEKSSFFLTIAGNIGVGKTTLTTEISKHFGWQAIYEQVIDNPYLEDFYADMKRWSFNLQVYFLSRRFNDQRASVERTTSCVQDRSIYEDVEIFAYILYKQGYLDQRDYNNYRDLYYIMTRYLRKPDLILYLRASTWTLITRIRKRGREYEKRIFIDYLHELNQAYERWIQKIQKEIEVMVVDADALDYDKNPQALVPVYEELEHYYNKRC